MKTRFLALGIFVAAAAPLAAQQRLILGANVGGSSAGSDLTTATGWKSGWSAGANLTYKLWPRLALRADADMAQNDLSGGTGVPGEARFNKMAYMGDAVWQITSGGGRLSPYVLGGVGAVRVQDKGTSDSFTHFGGNLGLGADYKLGKLGLRAEGRNVMYKFDRYGYNRTQNDFIWQGGLTLGI